VKPALALLCQIGVVLLTAGLLLLAVVFFTVRGGGAVIHVNPIALVVWIAFDALLIYVSARLNRTTPNSRSSSLGEGL